MKETKFTCSCGCGKTAPSYEDDEAPEGWFILKNPVPAKGDSPKLLNPPHLATIQCLKKWSTLAVKELPDLLRDAGRFRPHGMIQANGLAELYI